MQKIDLNDVHDITLTLQEIADWALQGDCLTWMRDRGVTAEQIAAEIDQCAKRQQIEYGSIESLIEFIRDELA